MLSRGAGKHVAGRYEHAYPRPAAVDPVPQFSCGRVKACHPCAEVISRSILKSAGRSEFRPLDPFVDAYQDLAVTLVLLIRSIIIRAVTSA